MASEIPVVLSQTGQPITGTALRGKTTDGSWRPDTPFGGSDGLKVTMRRAAGLTPAGILRVPMRFQVPLVGEFRRPYRFNWSTFDTIGGGQRSRPMGAQLLELQVDTILMDDLAAQTSTGLVVWEDAPDPQRILNELRFISGSDGPRKGKAAPFRLTVVQPAVWRQPVVNIVAVLTNVEPAQHPGDVATEFLSMTFLEYPEHDTSGGQRALRKPARRHKVDFDRDTLYRLATRFLHQASAWRQIAKANGITGVSPGSISELKAWCKRHHKPSLIIPTVEIVSRNMHSQHAAGGGRTLG